MVSRPILQQATSAPGVGSVEFDADLFGVGGGPAGISAAHAAFKYVRARRGLLRDLGPIGFVAR